MGKSRADKRRIRAKRTAKFGEAPPGFKFTAKGELKKGSIGEGGGFFGTIRKGVKGLGKIAHKAAPALAFIPGVGTVAAAGIGALGGLAAGKGFKGALTGGLKGAAGGLAKTGLNKILGSGPGQDIIGDKIKSVISGGAGKIKDVAGQGLGLLGGEGGMGRGALNLGALALGGLSVADSKKQRESAESFNQQKLDILTANLGKAEAEFDTRAPLRAGGQEALLSAIDRSRSSVDPFSSFIKSSKKRKPGEFSSRRAA